MTTTDYWDSETGLLIMLPLSTMLSVMPINTQFCFGFVASVHRVANSYTRANWEMRTSKGSGFPAN